MLPPAGLGVAAGTLLLIGAVGPAAHAAEAGAPQAPSTAPGLTDELDAAEADGDRPRQLVDWNHYEGPYATLRVGGGLLWDYSAYAQDEESKQQMRLSPTDGFRDFRLLFKGKFPKVKGLTYTLGYMYDGAKKEWRFRQTGLMYEVPALLGSIFLGRTKEGFSTNKIMVGYQGWTNERATVNDALIPILGDGIKWTGGIPGGKLVYNVGYFYDKYSETESFNKNDNQLVARAVWLPFMGTNQPLLHLAIEGRWADANDGQLQYRSKPEAFLAQSYAIDTGKFPANHANTLGVEAYYRPGPLMFGMEYFFNQVSSPETGNPLFHGGEIFASYLFTGELHPYNTKGAYFEAVTPSTSVFDGGPGAMEVVLRYSYSDFDSGTIRGGKFWRITPVLNWYLSPNMRLEFVYGYGHLDRFDLTGATQFFQTRIQLQL
ncbi:MAG TPA: porin [Steroidobacteraceae bacterium]|nr:porin [Steroidobacteraceae bacterium]